MSIKIQIVNPAEFPSWDEMLLGTAGASFFHSAAWARVLSASYGYAPLYLAGIESGRLRTLIPLMEVDSFFTGKRGVCLPFTDYCDPILDEGVAPADVLDEIIALGRKRGWKYVELRGGNGLLADAASRSPVPGSPVPNPRGPNLEPAALKAAPDPFDGREQRATGNRPYDSSTGNPQPATGTTPFRTYFLHTLDLTRGEAALFSGLRDSTRRNIRKAEKEKVEVRIGNTAEALAEFCRLNCLTRREHGLPPQPARFFTRVQREVLSRGNGFVALAFHRGRVVAANVYFHFGRGAVYKYGASDKRYQALRANNLVMWEAVRRFCSEGFKSLCFGRTEPENDGLRQFKRGWGAVEETVHYFRYDLRRGVCVPGMQGGGPRYTALFRAAPVPVLNAIGSIFYRHMG